MENMIHEGLKILIFKNMASHISVTTSVTQCSLNGLTDVSLNYFSITGVWLQHLKRDNEFNRFSKPRVKKGVNHRI